MGLVALLILVDVLVLTVWHLTDPVRCSRSVGAVVKVKTNCEPAGLDKQNVHCNRINLIYFFNYPN